MRSRRTILGPPLLLGIALSLTVHLGIIVPALVAAMTAHTHAAPHMESDFNAEDLASPLVIEPEIELGRSDSERSTLVWLGHEEYQQHLAALSEVEQAAFDERPFGSAPANPAPPSPVVPEQPLSMDAPTEPTPSDAPALDHQPTPQPADSPDEPTLEPARTTSSGAAVPDAAEPVPNAQPAPELSEQVAAADAPPGVDASLPTAHQGAHLGDVARVFEHMLSVAQQLAQDMTNAPVTGEAVRTLAPSDATPASNAAKPESQQPINPRDPSANAAPPTPRVTATPSQPDNAPPGEQREADQSDQESDPSSTVDVPIDEINVGKPVATRGLELKPRKPTFTNLVRMTALPGNPLCEIRFQRNGKPALARLLTSSGDSRVDDAVLASLYRWRATGDDLETLADDETINVRIRIILNSR